MINCIFCSIANNKYDKNKIFDTSDIFVIQDVNPQAPVHLLIIPKKHIETINSIEVVDIQLMGNIILIAKQMSKINNIDKTGYRLVFNTNLYGGQSIFHIHLHLIGGRQMIWPPG